MPVKIPRVPVVAVLAAVAAAAALLTGPSPLRTPASAGMVRMPAAVPATQSPAPATPRASAPASAPPVTARPGIGPELPGATPVGSVPPVVDHGPRTGNKVALTFDADMTGAMRRQLRSGAVRSYANLKIIDLLEREGVPATFFLTGMWVEQYPALTRRLAANPRFELANHTYGHLAFTPDCYGLPRVPEREMTADVARTFDLVAGYGGRQTRYFRFPGLCHDRNALDALAPLGLTVVDGDVVSGDPFAKSWRPVVRAALDGVRPGSVIILHVTEANAPMTDEALPHILAGLAERGLEPAPLSEVLGQG
ncbi:Peptidoglycan/xylan/chitin deacetylase, PgdA/CDA1 family [Micromonospora echinaurantiaca]|uniref:Peptidoglycan/xylan/chitin deacetylase, PgdA/CDA1 family n=1 Tax=Micromonospora echinaurantiaca TaxID=47857 RepID=A0A1C5GUC0_9ACTN|nr:polysaccharide deacetylase family protein [Micromonospora echinaurantiaca]SCG37360.1 Peptidoglycan/xylan/chitin deacetylase, PgdA/CDA1 family [Micromonospora echinaurantiaca]